MKIATTHMRELLELKVVAVGVLAACMEGESAEIIADELASKIDILSLHRIFDEVYDYYDKCEKTSNKQLSSITLNKLADIHQTHATKLARFEEERRRKKKLNEGGSANNGLRRASIIQVKEVQQVDTKEYDAFINKDETFMESEELTICLRDLIYVRRLLCTYVPDYKRSTDVSESFATFEPKLGHVEVAWNKKTVEVLFPIPYVTKYLSATTKQKFHEECDLDTPETRVKGLMTGVEDFYDEMDVLHKLSKVGYFKFMLKKYIYIRYLLYAVVFLLNYGSLLSLTQSSIGRDGDKWSTSERIQVLLGLILLVGYGSIFAYWGFQVFFLKYAAMRRLVNGLDDGDSSVSESEDGAPMADEHAMIEVLFEENEALIVSKKEEEYYQQAPFIVKAFGYLWTMITSIQAMIVGAYTFVNRRIVPPALRKQVGKFVSGWNLKVFWILFLAAVMFVMCCVIHFFIFQVDYNMNANRLLMNYFIAGLVTLAPIAIFCFGKMIDQQLRLIS